MSMTTAQKHFVKLPLSNVNFGGNRVIQGVSERIDRNFIPDLISALIRIFSISSGPIGP